MGLTAIPSSCTDPHQATSLSPPESTEPFDSCMDNPHPPALPLHPYCSRNHRKWGSETTQCLCAPSALAGPRQYVPGRHQHPKISFRMIYLQNRIKIWVIQLRHFRTGWSFASQKQPQLVLYKDVNEIQDILVLKALHNCKLLLSETAFARCSLNSQAAWGKEALVQCGRSSCRGYNTLAKHSQAFSCPSTTIFKQKLADNILLKLPPAPALSSANSFSVPLLCMPYRSLHPTLSIR